MKEAFFVIVCKIFADLCLKRYYKVVTCGDYMTGEQRHDQKEFVWTLYKNKEEWENSTKWIIVQLKTSKDAVVK